MHPPANRQNVTIGHYFDIDILQRIQDTFAQAMGVAAVTVDRDGKPVTRTSNFQPICLYFRETSGGLARCQASDAEGGEAAFAKCAPHAYVCKSGLLDAAAPITVDGEYIGCVLCGQVLPADARAEFIEEIISRAEAIGLSPDEVIPLVRKVPVMPRWRFRAAAEMLSVVANYIIELGSARLAQERMLAEAQEKAALEAALQEAQLRALKAQINPHFLFNSLTLVAYTAFEEKASRTEEIAYTLSDLLRYSLRNIATSVELGEEMEMIERYLAIQQVRFGERLRWHTYLEPELRLVNVPCMVIQPLVENAVIHGAEPLQRPVTVEVAATHVDGQVCLDIRDNGAGMGPELAARITARDYTQLLERPSLGLQNVIQRLEGEYGPSFSLTVQSEFNLGTHIQLILPGGPTLSGDHDAWHPDS
ncbi:MAG: PocR ligand-binding domain-containing protein [Anaerolineae bacterium]|nr:PocR ligand-binding domain-containing protein [Anaerolineae bacterium]